MIQETIERLKSLQDVLMEKFRVEAEIHDLPKALSTKTELVNRLKKAYIEKNAQYEELKSRISSLRIHLDDAEREREKYEGQMDQIKTQREYEALDKEIREASEKEANFRRELQREERALEEMQESLEREEKMIHIQEEELASEQQKIEEETESRKEQVAELESEEKDIVPGLDEELLFKFERIIRSKAGEGIVPIRKGVCTGCQMILPMQFVNEVRQGESILFCPYCSKIVFYHDETEDAGFGEDDAEGLADLINVDEFDAELEGEEDREDLEMGSDGDDELLEEEEEGIEADEDEDDEVEEEESEDNDDLEDDDLVEEDEDLEEDSDDYEEDFDEE